MVCAGCVAEHQLMFKEWLLFFPSGAAILARFRNTHVSMSIAARENATREIATGEIATREIAAGEIAAG